jgi:opacity protein-like surface antigen
MIAACASTVTAAAVLFGGIAMAQEVNPPAIYAESAPAEQMAQPVLKPSIDDTQTAANPLPKAQMSDRWSGPYAGLHLAYTMLEDSAPAKGNGATFGAFVGYNVPIRGGLVAGFEASYTHMDIEFDDNSGVRGRDTLSARVRGGYATDKFFAYGLIGAEHALASAPFAPGFKFRDTAMVWGAGVDYAVNHKIAVGVEYTRSHFTEFDYPTFPIPVDVTMQKVQTRVTYRLY